MTFLSSSMRNFVSRILELPKSARILLVDSKAPSSLASISHHSTTTARKCYPLARPGYDASASTNKTPPSRPDRIHKSLQTKTPSANHHNKSDAIIVRPPHEFTHLRRNLDLANHQRPRRSLATSRNLHHRLHFSAAHGIRRQRISFRATLPAPSRHDRFILGSSLQSLVGGMGPDCLYRAANDRHASLTRQAPARLQSLLARLPPALQHLRHPLCSSVAGDLARIALARFLQLLSNVRSGRPFLVRPARVGRSIRGPIRRARIFLPRISSGRAFALHRNLRSPSFRDALHDDPFHEAVARGSRVHRGRIGSRQSCVEDEINLGRRLRSLRRSHHNGSAGAFAQRPAALAALVSEKSSLFILARILSRILRRSCFINCARFCTRCGNPRLRRSAALDRNQFHLKNQRRIRRDSAACAALPISQIRRHK